MVARASPFESSHRAYHSGGSRSVIEKADDSKLMQEHSGNFMKGESRKGVESPQNYGFTSVVHEADKDKDGNIEMGAESFVSFQGGNRSFPVYGNTDDRRHRLHGLKEGDSAMFRGKDDRQQFHLSGDGNYMTARSDRKQRIALVPPPQDDKKQQGGGGSPQVSALAGNGGSGAASGGGKDGGKKKPTGQKDALDDNKKSDIYFDQSGSVQDLGHGASHAAQRPSDSSTFYTDRTKSTQATDSHVHIRLKDMRIFVDESGCWSEVPILVKKDVHCKE